MRIGRPWRAVALIVLLGGCLPACRLVKEGTGSMKTESFGTVNGQEAELFTLTNANGIEARITSYGALLVSLRTPDRSGRLENIVLGFDDLDGYLAGHPYFGATVGRYANRIAGGKFTLDGKEYTLATNNGPNHLHGGEKGFDKVIWKADPRATREGPSVKFSYTSPDGEEGYPGTLTANVTYTLTDDDELRIDYEATTDRATPVNLTNHSYFNLGGPASGDILGHQLMINASRFLEADGTLIPTGRVVPVAGTPLDFRDFRPIGSRIDQIEGDQFAGGYDHCFILDKDVVGELTLAAKVRHPENGRTMEIRTTEPGVQFYTGNFLDGSLTGAGGVVYEKHQGFCLETQHFPDSVNQPDFPTVILRPGQTYTHTTIHRFAAE